MKGDQINNNNGAIQTRSKSKTNEAQWTQIPAAVKIYKLLLNELSHSLEEKGDDGGGGEEDGEDEWENESDDEEGENVDGGAVLSDLLASGDSGEDWGVEIITMRCLVIVGGMSVLWSVPQSLLS